MSRNFCLSAPAFFKVDSVDLGCFFVATPTLAWVVCLSKWSRVELLMGSYYYLLSCQTCSNFDVNQVRVSTIEVGWDHDA